MMSLDYRPQTFAAEDYERIFALERAKEYPVIDALEARYGYAIDRTRLETAARVLECPIKAAPPNWQHGRVLYAVAKDYLSRQAPSEYFALRVLDIGTAKGFSALCLLWALEDRVGEVYSVDVMSLLARIRRNTIAEVDGLRTLPEIINAWPESRRIHFAHSTSLVWLRAHPERVHVVFVDGKHDYSIVLKEGQLLADRQQSGDVVVFDDVQMPGVGKAVKQLDAYDCEYVDLGSVNRRYAIGVRR